MIEVRIEKDLGSFRLDAEFTAGNEILALLGGSGSGKSLTLRCIAGVEKPDRGRIVVDDVVFFDSEMHIDLTPRQRKVGLLFQNYALFPTMTVLQNVMTGVRTGTRAEKRAAAMEAIARYELRGLEDRYPHQLSGGQQQRAALARILVGKPRILMLDEPFSALDAHLRDQMEREVLALLRDFGGTAILVSHSRDEVFRMADRVAVLDGGRIDALGEKHAVFREPGTYTAALLTGCKNFSAVSGFTAENGFLRGSILIEEDEMVIEGMGLTQRLATISEGRQRAIPTPSRWRSRTSLKTRLSMCCCSGGPARRGSPSTG